MGKMDIACICGVPGLLLFLFAVLCSIDFTLSILEEPEVAATNKYDNLDYGVPGKCDQIINREGYALGYIEDWEQPAWVSYRLTAEEAASKQAIRENKFAADSEISTGSASLEDYKGSGYDRGHLAPAADMQWSTKVMRESFLMSNMSPQKPEFNRGIWKQAESYARNMAIEEKSVFIITGPIFYPTVPTNRIGKNNVAVPHAFYKIIYAETTPARKIGFIIPNVGTNVPVNVFTSSVEHIEKITGLRFFNSNRQ